MDTKPGDSPSTASDATLESPAPPPLSLATVTRVGRRPRNSAASVASTSVSRRTRGGTKESSAHRSAAPGDIADQYREVMTEPPLSNLIGHGRSHPIAMDAVPGLLAVGGAFGCAVFSTHVRPPFPIAAVHRAGPSDSPVSAIHLDPFAPHHRYLAAVREDGSVSVVSTRAGYTYSVDHAHHTPSSVVAATWSMALHAPKQSLPVAADDDGENDNDGTEARASPASSASAPARAPLPANTPRVFVTLGSDGKLAVLDPTTHQSYVVGRVPPAAAVLGASSDETAGAAEVTTSVPLGWKEMSLVAFRDDSRSNEGSDCCGVNVVLAGDVDATEGPADADSLALEGGKRCGGRSHVVAVLRCRRSGYGHRLLPPAAPSSLPSPAFPLLSSDEAAASPIEPCSELPPSTLAVPPLAGTFASDLDIEARDRDRVLPLVPHVICCAAINDATDASLSGFVPSPRTPASDPNNSAFGLACYPFSSGALVVSRERAGRFWVIDGARGRLAASATARTGGGSETAYNSRAVAAPPSLQLDAADADHEHASVGETSFPTSAVSAPPFLRSGTLRRHLVVQRGPAMGREVKLAVVHTPAEALSSWLVESNTWDGIPLPRGVSDPSKMKAAVAGTAPLRVSEADAAHHHSPGRRDLDGPTHPTTPVLFVATPCGGISLLELPGGIAVTPLLEAILRERYTGAAPVAKPPPPDLVAAAALPKPRQSKSLFKHTVGDEVASAARWFGTAAKSASAAMAAAVAASASSSNVGGAGSESPARMSQQTSYSDLSEAGSRASSPRYGYVFGRAPSTVHVDPSTPPRRQRAVLVYTGTAGNATTTATTTTGSTVTHPEGAHTHSSRSTSPSDSPRASRVPIRRVHITGAPPVPSFRSECRDGGGRSSPGDYSDTASPMTPAPSLREHHAAFFDEREDAEGAGALEDELAGMRREAAIEHVVAAEEERRAEMGDAERRAWTVAIAGAHEVEMDRREELRREASEMRRLQAGNLTAWALIAKRREENSVLRPTLEVLGDGEGVTKEFLASVLRMPKATDADPATPSTPGPRWGAPHPRRSNRLVPTAALEAVMSRDRKLFDMAELRLSLAAEREGAADNILIETVVYEDWKRGKDDTWAPCAVPHSLASDGTAVDMPALHREADASRDRMRNRALSLGLSKAVVDTIGVWRADPWQYAHRWPANAAEGADRTFWSDPTSETLCGDASSAKLLQRKSDSSLSADGGTKVLKVRRRVWKTIDVEPKAAAALADIRRAHRGKLEALARSLGLPVTDAAL